MLAAKTLIMALARKRATNTRAANTVAIIISLLLVSIFVSSLRYSKPFSTLARSSSKTECGGAKNAALPATSFYLGV